MRFIFIRPAVLAIALFCVGGLPVATLAIAQPAGNSTENTAELAQIETAISDLTSDSYLRRKRATTELIRIGAAAVAPLVDQLESGDLETTERVLSVLQEVAIRSPIGTAVSNAPTTRKSPNTQDSSDTKESPDTQKSSGTQGAPTTQSSSATQASPDIAWEELERVSTLGGSRGTRAKLAVKEVRDVRRALAVQILGDSGVFIGMTDFIIGAREQIKQIVEIDDSFEGDLRLMDLLRWVDGIEFARIKGSAIRKEVLAGIIQMPDLQTLSIMQGELSLDELKTLGGIDELRNLELRYVPMDGERVDQLATLPIRVSLTLNGTAAPIDRVDALRRTVPGLTIDLKQGGFLGVRCFDNFNECLINEVIIGKAAEQAGLLPGDVIVEADGKPIKQFKDLQDAINAHIPGDTIEINYRRGMADFQTKAKLGKLEDH
ncbi:PDZ domain-containing protein [Neorhodopirellula lusitana]|uniref:PDZ domain-containing protein n=1 Tax=Neorhodopirellula lusitana TaxID=445327 RepID=UPI00384E55C0